MPSYGEKIVIKLDQEKLLLYDVDPQDLYYRLKTAFNSNQAGELRASYEILPIVLVEDQKYISNILTESFVKNTRGEEIPLRNFVKLKEYMVINNQRRHLRGICSNKYGYYNKLNRKNNY